MLEKIILYFPILGLIFGLAVIITDYNEGSLDVNTIAVFWAVYQGFCLGSLITSIIWYLH